MKSVYIKTLNLYSITLNRFAVCTTDASNEQRFRIKQRQLFEMTLEGLKQKRMEEKIIKKHKNILRMIKKVEVVFPDTWNSKLKGIENGEYSVRNNLCYLSFIASSAIKDQHKRKLYTEDDEFGKFNYVEVTKDDIKLANEIMLELFGKSIKDLKPPQKVFLEKLQNYVRGKIGNKNLRMTEILFYEDEIRKGTNLSYWQVNRYLNDLIKLEYITLHSRGEHNKQSYKLEIAEIKDDSDKYLTGLIDPEKL